MKEKKNIDRIFQEKFKDFESEPHSRNWDEIASRLDRKDRKRPFIIPLWFKLGGVAAVLAVIVSGILFLNNQNSGMNEPGIVIEETESSKTEDPKEKESINEIDEGATDSRLSSQDSLEAAGSQESNSGSPSSSKTNSAYANREANTENTKTLNQKTNTSNNHRNPSGIAANNSSVKNNQTEKATPEIIQPETTGKNDSERIASSSDVVKDSSAVNNSILKPSEEDKEEKNALAQLEDDKKLKDGEESLETDSNKKQLRLSTFAAPVFYANVGAGNELSNQFAGNSSSSEVTFSYGVKVAYDIGKKLKIRTGISKVDMSYNIQDISYSPTAASAGFDNINPVEDNLEIRTESSRGIGPQNDFSNSAGSSLASSVFTPGEINQQFGFIEIPVELEYAVIDSKFGLNLIGGASSLILDNNRVDLVAGDSRTTLGEASNINNTSFSTNVGVGMDYEISNKFSISVEPIVKYQLNTFTDVSNVRPLNFGIYSGLNYKF